MSTKILKSKLPKCCLLKSKICLLLALIIVAGGLLMLSNMLFLQKIHGTFENYYAFRGCTQLLKKDNNYAICKNNKGDAIKLVQSQNKWYLDGDLPLCISSLCF